MNEPTKPTSIIDADAPESRMADFSEIPLIDLAPIYGDDAKAKQRMAAALTVYSWSGDDMSLDDYRFC